MYQSNCNPNTTFTPAMFKKATGKLKYNLTNDYLFRATLQESPATLREVVRSVLGLSLEQIHSVEVLNPIILGQNIMAKDFILDVRVLLNNNTQVNLEMQVLNHGNWPERSLLYLCRSFDQLNKGEDYLHVKPVIQVCFLNFTLFEDNREFFSTHMITNIKNHRIYSDKLKLLVVDLTCIELATEEDKDRHTDCLAKLFKATTWEEINMLASNNSMIENAAETIYRLSADEAIREQCEAREDYYRLQRTVQKEIEQQKTQLDEQKTQIDEQKTQIDEQKTQIDEQKTQIDEQKIQINRQQSQLEQQQNQIEQQKTQLDQKEQYIQRTKQLFTFLIRDMRHEDMQRACTDDDFLKMLLDEYHV